MTGTLPDSRITVVGAGPVGMVAGLALARAGHDVTILERTPDEVRAQWRGSTLHPPTLAMLAELDLAGPALHDGVHVQRLGYGDLEIGEPVSLDYRLLSGLTPYPFRLQYEQYKLVRLLRAALAAEPRVSLEFDRAVVGVHQHDEAVTVDVDGPAGRDTVTSAWVIGADGAHSTVRSLLGIGFPGFTYATRTLVVATPIPLEQYVDGLAAVGYWTGPHGRVSFIRTPDIWRMAMSTTTASDDDREPAMPHPQLLANLELLLRGRLRAGEVELAQHQLYRSHQRVADTFRAGRVLLAGDAAHLSSTTGGMGLNSGVHDAMACARALAAGDPDGAAHAYAEQRRAIAEQVVQPATTANREGADVVRPAHRRERLQRLADIAADPVRARAHLAAASMLALDPPSEPGALSRPHTTEVVR